MKILIISMNVGRTAPGIIFERLIQGLSSTNQVDLLTADFDPSIELTQVSNIIIYKRIYIHPRIHKLFISVLGVDPFDCYWAWKSKKLLKSKIKKQYDVVLSFLSFRSYGAMIAGSYLTRKNQSKFAVHSLDAIPAPLGWLDYDRFYKGLTKMMKRYLSTVDGFFTTNQQMLNYQLSTFIPKKNIITNIIYNPGQDENIGLPKAINRKNNFVYMGGIYGLRKSTYILKGFEKLLTIFPESKLIFIGTPASSFSLSELRPESLRKIEIVPFTKDLGQYYSDATALIDIDADIENDVFLSSKVTTYVMNKCMIICETGKNSPARNLFNGIDSIIKCDHDSNQLFEAMKKSILMRNKISFDDRNNIIKLFRTESIIAQLNNSLDQLANL